MSFIEWQSRAGLERPEVGELLMRDFGEAFRQGGAGAAADGVANVVQEEAHLGCTIPNRHRHGNCFETIMRSTMTGS